MKIYGPYVRKSDNRRIIIEYDGIKRSAKLYSRYLIEQKFGRKLEKSEEVDHIDGDVTNDSLSNLRILSGTKNKQLANLKRYGPKIKIPCSYCGIILEISKSRQYGKLKFCTRSHRAKYYGNQYQQGRVVKSQTHWP